MLRLTNLLKISIPSIDIIDGIFYVEGGKGALSVPCLTANSETNTHDNFFSFLFTIHEHDRETYP